MTGQCLQGQCWKVGRCTAWQEQAGLQNICPPCPSSTRTSLALNRPEGTTDVKAGVELRIWLKQGKEKRLPARKKDSRQGF